MTYAIAESGRAHNILKFLRGAPMTMLFNYTNKLCDLEVGQSRVVLRYAISSPIDSLAVKMGRHLLGNRPDNGRAYSILTYSTPVLVEALADAARVETAFVRAALILRGASTRLLSNERIVVAVDAETAEVFRQEIPATKYAGEA